VLRSWWASLDALFDVHDFAGEIEMVKFPGLLKTLMHRAGAVRHAALNKSMQPPHPKKMLFESLEPRLLLSADLAPEVSSTLISGVNQFKDWTAALATYQQLGEQLPVVNTA